jgi:hypothetical protein
MHITEEQRKAFAELVKDAERKFDKDFDGYLNELKHDLTPKIEAKTRARMLLESVRTLRSKLSEATMGLRKLGFHVDDGMIAIDYDTRDDTRRELEQVKQTANEERDKAKAKFRKALFNVLSADTTEEAKRIVEEVL